MRPLPVTRPSIKGCQRGVGRALVLENTKRFGSIERITITRKAALRNSSRSLAPSVLFSAEAHLSQSP
jgi:hypothetical protein